MGRWGCCRSLTHAPVRSAPAGQKRKGKRVPKSVAQIRIGIHKGLQCNGERGGHGISDLVTVILEKRSAQTVQHHSSI